MERQETIRAFIQDRVGPEIGFGPDDDIFQLGLVNSMFALQLVAFLEEQFGITVENEDLDLANFNTVHHIVAFIARKKGEA